MLRSAVSGRVVPIASPDRSGSGAPPPADRLAAALRHEPPGVVELAGAAAVLDPDAGAATRARVAGLDDIAAARAAERLAELGVLDGARCGDGPARAAVLDAAGDDRCRRLHARAARVLDCEGAPLERVAHHHLAAGPPWDGGVVELLHVAAARAEQSGDRTRAGRLLEHALTGPVGGRRRAALLVDLSVVARVAAPATAHGHLAEALSLVPCARERAELLARTVARSPGGRRGPRAAAGARPARAGRRDHRDAGGP
ncbi:hypothetical protein [Pseudonocardia sp. ICBG1293]|uniref:hypothetical protein n=1 Tax=Pseudonocardia sp. ICBG1293 TaxID=2844382 RepID=UPI001CC978DA|nr:hypothetical protein [Pseudonocardia sp. ICBG1293]